MKKICFALTALLFFAMLSCSAQKAKPRLQNGIQQFDQGNYDTAISEFTEAITLDPKLSEAFLYRARTYHIMHDVDHAIADYTEAIRLDPNLSAAYLLRGSLHPIDDDESAIADYTEALRIDPNLSEAYIYRGNLYLYYRQDYDRAVADFETAFELDPDGADYRYQLANAYFYRGNNYNNQDKDYARAIADFEAAVELEPDETAYRNSLAISRQNLAAAQRPRQNAGSSSQTKRVQCLPCGGTGRAAIGYYGETSSCYKCIGSGWRNIPANKTQCLACNGTGFSSGILNRGSMCIRCMNLDGLVNM